MSETKMDRHLRAHIDSLTFHVAPSDQGQMVEYSFAVDGDWERLWMREEDGGFDPFEDGRVVYYWADLSDAVDPIEPWNKPVRLAAGAEWLGSVSCSKDS